MKTVARFLAILLLTCLFTAPVQAAGLDEQGKVATAYPQYPLWVARILAPFGFADAQALAGMYTMTFNLCKGYNWLLASAQQHFLFGEWHLIGYYLFDNDENPKQETREKIFLWLLHWRTHFPNEEDRSFYMQKNVLKLPPDREYAMREKSKTWTPADERPMEPASCPDKKFTPP